MHVNKVSPRKFDRSSNKFQKHEAGRQLRCYACGREGHIRTDAKSPIRGRVPLHETVIIQMLHCFEVGNVHPMLPLQDHKRSGHLRDLIRVCSVQCIMQHDTVSRECR
jgi:hypothetical protein